MTTEAKLNLTATFDRPLAWVSGDSVRYLVATLTAEKGAKAKKVQERSPLNLGLVIDASGSMSGEKLVAAKRAAIGVVEQLKEKDHLSVVSFASDLQVHLDAAGMDKAGRQKAITAIKALETRGCTNLSGGWFKGAECVARAAEGQTKSAGHLIILSDGMANEGIADPMELSEHAGELRLRGITTSTLGIGDGYFGPLLQGIAENGGGRMHDAEMADEIETVLLGEIGEAADTAVDDVTLEIDVPASCKAEILGINAATSHGNSISALIGPMAAGREKSVVLKVTCPEGDAGTELTFVLRARGKSNETGATIKTKPVEASLRLALSKENNAQERNLEASTTAARLWQSHVIRRVTAMNRNGDYRAAHSYLEMQLRFFERYVHDLPGGRDMVRELAIMLRRIDRPWNERTRKEMELASYKTARMERDLRTAERMSWSSRLDEDS